MTTDRCVRCGREIMGYQVIPVPSPAGTLPTCSLRCEGLVFRRMHPKPGDPFSTTDLREARRMEHN